MLIMHKAGIFSQRTAKKRISAVLTKNIKRIHHDPLNVCQMDKPELKSVKACALSTSPRINLIELFLSWKCSNPHSTNTTYKVFKFIPTYVFPKVPETRQRS